MMTGTLWHRYIGQLLEQQGVPVMREVRVDAGLPEGWSGTLDLLTYDVSEKGHMLRDVKTQRAEAFQYQSGVKEDHLWQLSAYHAALVRMGYPMVDEMEVVYVPMNALAGSDVQVSLERCHPLPVADLWELMEDRWAQLQRYLEAFRATNPRLEPGKPWLIESFLSTDWLAAPPEREQRIYKGQTKSGGAYDLKLVPGWRAAYCPFDPPLCTCSEQGQTKIGSFVEVGERSYTYEPREGYEQIEPVVFPEGAIIRV